MAWGSPLYSIVIHVHVYILTRQNVPVSVLALVFLFLPMFGGVGALQTVLDTLLFQALKQPITFIGISIISYRFRLLFI